MTTTALIKLVLTGFAIAGILYVCIGSGAFSNEKKDWWGSLPQQKKTILIAALAATVVQLFL